MTLPATHPARDRNTDAQTFSCPCGLDFEAVPEDGLFPRCPLCASENTVRKVEA